MSNWKLWEHEKPKLGIEVIAYSPHWIHENTNPTGVRTGFLNGHEVFYSALWVKAIDCYVEDDEVIPTHWQYKPDSP